MQQRYKIATAVAILFHVIGLIGIFFFDDGLIMRTSPIHLLLMLGLIVYTTEKPDKYFLLFFLLCFCAGIAAEIYGTATGLLFGQYEYGTVLGPRVRSVPLIIGVNWFLIIYCAGSFVSRLLTKLSAKAAEMMNEPPKSIRLLTIVTDGSLLCVFFDWVMEPAAVKLGYWQWLGNGEIPFYNYVCWFVISAALLAAFVLLKPGRSQPGANKFAVNLLLIMMMFFMIVRTFA